MRPSDKDIEALHALEAGDDIGVRVGKHVADMQMSDTVGGGVSIE